MKQWILVFSFVLISFLLEVSVLSLYTKVSLPIALIALIFCAVKYGDLKGQIVGFVLGFMMDVVSGTPLGFYALSYVTIGYLLGLWRKETFVNSWFFSLLLFVVSRIILTALSLLMALFFESSPWESTGWSQNFLLGLIFCPLYISFLNFLNALLMGRRIKIDIDF